MPCSHNNHLVECVVEKITHDKTDELLWTHVEVKVHCTDCGQEYVFAGFPAGLDPMQPTVGPFGNVARLPIYPSNEVHVPRPDGDPRGTVGLNRQ